MKIVKVLVLILVLALIIVLALTIAFKRGEKDIEIGELPEIVFFEFNFEKYNVHGHYMTNQGEVYYFKIIPYENFSFEWHESNLGYHSQRPDQDTLSELLDFFKSADKTTPKNKADIEELNENYRKLLKVKTSDENYECWESNEDWEIGIDMKYGIKIVNGKEEAVFLQRRGNYDDRTIDPNGEEILSWLFDKLPFSEPYYE